MRGDFDEDEFDDDWQCPEDPCERVEGMVLGERESDEPKVCVECGWISRGTLSVCVCGRSMCDRCGRWSL